MGMQFPTNRDGSALGKRLLALWQHKVALLVLGMLVCGGLGALLALPTVPAAPVPPPRLPQSSPVTSEGWAIPEPTPSSSQELVGTIAGVQRAASMFGLQQADGTLTMVNVTGSTRFHGGVRSFAALRSGMPVQVTGTWQPDGTFSALLVRVGGDGG